MELRYSYRIDPRPRHRLALGKAFGCARFVVNDALAAREAALPGRGAVPNRCAVIGPADRSQTRPGASMADRSLSRGAAAGPSGPEYGLPELFRLPPGHPQGAEDG